MILKEIEKDLASIKKKSKNDNKKVVHKKNVNNQNVRQKMNLYEETKKLKYDYSKKK